MADEPTDGEHPRLPPHLDPRGPRRADLPRATAAYRGSLPLPPAEPPADPGRPQRTRRRRYARALSWIAVVTSVAVLAVSGVGYALVNHYDGKIARIDVFPGNGDGDRPEAAPRNAQNILLVGSDSREGLAAGQGVQGRGDTFVTGQRSDTIILAHLYGGGEQAQMVSFPRDSWVRIPSHVDPATAKIVPAQMGKLNRSLEIGGPALLIDTLEEMTGIRVDHYVQIDFNGFKGMVDALGGVEVCLSKPAKEKFSGIDLPAGRSTVKGDQALAFVRQRKGLPNGDLDRIARQQQFMGAMVRKVLSAGTLLNPFKVNEFLDIATRSLKVDEELETGDLQALALRFRNFSAGGVSFVTVPVATINGQRRNADGLLESVVLLDDARSAALFDRLRNDVPPGEPAPQRSATPAPALIVAPSAVRVRVYNGAGVPGLGRRAAADLTELGFRVIGAPGNRGSDATTTTVLHGPDRADSARTLAAAVPGAQTRLEPSLGGTLELVVGTDYSGARQVQVAGAPRPTPSGPAASATPKVQTAAEDPCAASAA